MNRSNRRHPRTIWRFLYRIHSLPWGPFSVFLVLGVILSGCCSLGGQALFCSRISNGSKAIDGVSGEFNREYTDAFGDLIDVLSRFNSLCPPAREAGDSEAADPVVLECDFLHAYLDATGSLRVSPVSPCFSDSLPSENTIETLYGVSESDNFQFTLQSESNLHVYVIGLLASGEFRWYFPRDTRTTQGDLTNINADPSGEGRNPVWEGTSVRIPSREGEWLYLSRGGRGGVDTFVVVASRVRQTELESALANATEEARRAVRVKTKGGDGTLIFDPLCVSNSRSGLVLPLESKGTYGDSRQVATDTETFSYSPSRFRGDSETVVLTYSVLHLPPRTP